MIHKLILILFIFTACTSCKKSLYKELQKTNTVILSCSINNKEINSFITDKETIQIFIDIFKKEQPLMPLRNATKIGLIEYYYNDSLLLSVTRYSDGISYKLEDKVICSKITYRAGMYFDELFGKIIK